MYVAPSFSLIQNQPPIERRPVAAATNFFIFSIIGLRLGPFSIGFSSGMFSPEYGLDGVRYALMTSLVVILWGVPLLSNGSAIEVGRSSSLFSRSLVVRWSFLQVSLYLDPASILRKHGRFAGALKSMAFRRRS